MRKEGGLSVRTTSAQDIARSFDTSCDKVQSSYSIGRMS